MSLRALAIALSGWAGSACAEMTFLHSFEWDIGRKYFGGLSGIELSNDGTEFFMLSDSGIYSQGTVVRDGDKITDMMHEPFQFLPHPPIWPSGDINRDTEGLALTSDGRIFVSYEGTTEVRQEHLPDGQADVLPRHADFDAMQTNGSLEALAVDTQGRLYAIPERSGRALRPFPVYRLDEDTWQVVFHIPRAGLLVPTGADIGPDGRLYLLERDFNGIGFSSRIRRFNLDGTGEETLLETQPGTHDNLEGIAVWTDALGLRITMVSDNNYRALQRTELVEYRLTH